MQVKRTQPAVAGFEAGGRGAQAKECGQPLEAGKDKDRKGILPWSLQKGTQPC